MRELVFQNAQAWLYGLTAVAITLGLFAWIQLRAGLRRRRVIILTSLRAALFIVLVFLMAKPVWTEPDDDQEKRDQVVLLIDRSESMSLREDGTTRYAMAVDYARSTLIPTLEELDVQVVPTLFAESSEQVTGSDVARTDVDGQETNLARAIAQNIGDERSAPLAVIALTDGVTNVESDNSRAVSRLVTHAVPFVGLGFGSETGGQMLSLESVSAPSLASPSQRFRVSARLKATGNQIPAFELLLLRDGQLVDRRTVPGFKGARLWQESFEVLEDEEGQHSYSVQVLPPDTSEIRTLTREGTQDVRIVAEGDVRVLYLQGGLTWDYKFIQLALRNDPAIKLSGLSRTASTSKFFENVQNDIDLVGGFPSTLEKLGEFRVIVLSNLRPGDLSPRQQDLLAQFCGELGGGVLMIGGPETFNRSWRDTRLEELLPVRFDALGRATGQQQFFVKLTDTAERHPVFRVSDQMGAREAWSNLPAFSNHAVVAGIKPGAEVWLEHTLPVGQQPKALMATQRFGNGVSSVICMQSFWKWRLAKESNTDHFDRFWQQLLRYLSEAGRESISLTLGDQSLQPGQPVELSIERRADASSTAGTAEDYEVVFRDQKKMEIDRETVRLEAGQALTVTFKTESEGTYTASVESRTGAVLASRSVDIRDVQIELVNTAIQMDTLAQWSGLSGGFSERADECPDLEERLTTLFERQRDVSAPTSYPMPAGMNGWCLTLLISLIGTEWILRKRWSLT